MMVIKILKSVLVFLVTIILVSCAEKKPPYYGAFYKNGNDFIELAQINTFGVPDSSELKGISVVPNSQPTIILWQQNTVLKNLQFFSVATEDELRYTAIPNDDIIALKPVDVLDPGQYCFIQGDPMAALLPAWCFEVQTTTSPVKSQTDQIHPLNIDSTQVSRNTSVPTNPTTPASTQTPQPSVIFQWSIKTGELSNIGVAADGTVYGFGPNLYAIISNSGEILKTITMDWGDCKRFLDFRITADGTIYSYDEYWEAGCIIFPGDPPIIEHYGNVDYFPYADSTKFIPRPDLGLIEHPDGFWADQYQPTTFINKEEKLYGFLDRNGTFVIVKLPDDFNMDSNFHECSITPIAELYCFYSVYDALGNSLGEKYVIIRLDGTMEFFNRAPEFYFGGITYFYEQGIVYSIRDNILVKHDLENNILAQYSLPPDFDTTHDSYAQVGLFVGNDLALYNFDQADHILSKYLLVNNQASTQDPTDIATALIATSEPYSIGNLDLTPPEISNAEVTTSSGLIYEDLRVGSGDLVKAGDTISINYTGWLGSGEKFDSSLDRGQTFDFTVGSGQVIAGLDEGVVGMRVNGTRLLIIAPHLGYGSTTQGVVPANSTIVFEVQLVAIPSITTLPSSIFTQSPTLSPTLWPGYEIAVIGAGNIPFQLRYNTNIWEYSENTDGSYVYLANKTIEKCSIDTALFAPEGGNPQSTNETKFIGTNQFDVLIVSGNGYYRAKYTLISDSGNWVDDVGIGVNARGSADACLKAAEQVIAGSADLLGQYK